MQSLIYFSLILTLLTSLWILPVSMKVSVNQLRRGGSLAQHFNLLNRFEGAWYWPILWFTAIVQMLAVLVVAFPMLCLAMQLIFRNPDLGQWFILYHEDLFNAKLVLYGIDLDRFTANLWCFASTFGTILGIKTSHLALTVSWRVWHSEKIGHEIGER